MCALSDTVGHKLYVDLRLEFHIAIFICVLTFSYGEP